MKVEALRAALSAAHSKKKKLEIWVDLIRVLFIEDLDEAIKECQQAYQLARQSGFRDKQCTMARLMANLQHEKKDYAQGLHYGNEAYRLALQMQNPMEIAKASINLAINHSSLYNETTAFESCKRGLAQLRNFHPATIGDEFQKIYMTCLLHNNMVSTMGMWESKVSNNPVYDLATRIMALRIFQKLEAPKFEKLLTPEIAFFKIDLVNNIAVAHATAGRFRKALSGFLWCGARYAEFGHVKQIANGLHLGITYMKLGQEEASEHAFQEALDSALATGRKEDEALIKCNLADLKFVQQNYDEVKALAECSLATFEASEDFFNQIKPLQLLARAAEERQAHQEHARVLKKLVAVREKFAASIADDRFQKLAIAFESELKQQRIEFLEKQVEFQEKELQNIALEIVEKNERFKLLKKQLKSRLNDESADTLFQVVEDVIDPKKDRNDLKTQFLKLHGDYLKVLHEAYPGLSRRQLQICALLRSNLSSKEIGSILHIDARSVDRQRTRIRKVLGIDTNQNMVTFLASYVSTIEPEALLAS